MSLFNLVNRIATEDGQVFESVLAAQVHELTTLLGGEPAISSATAIVENWPRILEIMTSEPGEEKPKARKRRKDFGTKRGKSAAAINADISHQARNALDAKSRAPVGQAAPLAETGAHIEASTKCKGK